MVLRRLKLDREHVTCGTAASRGEYRTLGNALFWCSKVGPNHGLHEWMDGGYISFMVVAHGWLMQATAQNSYGLCFRGRKQRQY